MRKLLDFLVRKRHWFLFILLEIISLTLVYRNNAYQRNIMFSSANVITGHITSVSGFVTSYLNLRDINRELLERNGQLEMELLELQDQLEMMRADTALFVGFAPDSTGQFPYSFVMADVVNNSVTYLSNYITVNKGRKDGVEPDTQSRCFLVTVLKLFEISSCLIVKFRVFFSFFVEFYIYL